MKKQNHSIIRRWWNIFALGRRYYSQCRHCWRAGVVHISFTDEKESGWFCGKHTPTKVLSDIHNLGITVKFNDSQKVKCDDVF